MLWQINYGEGMEIIVITVNKKSNMNCILKKNKAQTQAEKTV